MKKILYLLIVTLFTGSTAIVSAQETSEAKQTGWNKKLVAGFNVTQTSFNNWAPGGENTFAWQLSIDSRFERDREQYKWSNTGKFTFGKSKIGNLDSRKSIDEIKIESVWTYKMSLYINPYISLGAETQFASGYKYIDEQAFKVSDFMDPGYFLQGIGFGYSKKKLFKFRLGFALKETVTSDFPVPYADDPKTAEIEKTKTEAGSESVVDFEKKISQNMLLTSKLELFSNMQRFDEIDVKWDSVIAAKVSKYINVTFNYKLYYDKDISKKAQRKQSLAVGLTYSIF